MCSGPQGVGVNQRVPEALCWQSQPPTQGALGLEPSSALGSPGDPAQGPQGPALPLFCAAWERWDAGALCTTPRCLRSAPGAAGRLPGLGTASSLHRLPGLPSPLPCPPLFLRAAEFGSSSSCTASGMASSTSSPQGPCWRLPATATALPALDGAPPRPLLRLGARERRTKSLPRPVPQFPLTVECG